MIDAARWLATRVPPPPPALAGKLSAVLAGRTAPDSAALARMLVAEAAAMIASVGSARASAFDLLAADALVTYAMEAAADDPSSLEVVAREAMDRMARAVDE